MTHFVSADGIYKWVESLDSTWWNIIALTFVPSLFVMLKQRWVICLLNPLFIVTVLWLARNMWVFLQLLISSWYFPVFSLNWLIRQAGRCLSSTKINGQSQQKQKIKKTIQIEPCVFFLESFEHGPSSSVLQLFISVSSLGDSIESKNRLCLFFEPQKYELFFTLWTTRGANVWRELAVFVWMPQPTMTQRSLLKVFCLLLYVLRIVM